MTGVSMLTRDAIDRVVRAALDEDAPWGDITSTHLVPADSTISAALVAREPGVFAGGDVFRAAFAQADSRLQVDVRAHEGSAFAAGETLATVAGPARGALTAERVALNLVQRMCGIATLTERFVSAVEGTGARIADTRKTTPGLRALERHAVAVAGGANHRYSLSDAVLAKDNHLAVLAERGGSLTAGLREALRALPHTTHVEIEVDRIDQIEEVIAAGAHTVMLDNFSLDDLRRGVALIAGRCTVEASGGVSLDTVRAIAETGVDVISVGALTHSARAIDLGLDADLSS